MIYYNCRSGLQGLTRPKGIKLPVKYHQIIKRTCITTNPSSMQTSHAGHNPSSDEDEPHMLAGVLQRILQNAGALLEVGNCSITLTGVTGNTVVTRAALPNQGRPTRHTRFQLSEDVAGWVAQYRIPLVVNDTRLDPRFKRLEQGPRG